MRKLIKENQQLLKKTSRGMTGLDDSEYMATVEEAEDDFLVVDDDLEKRPKKGLEPIGPKPTKSNTTVDNTPFGIHLSQ